MDDNNRIDSVVILVGGRGRRMGKLSDNTQKCLIKIDGKKSILEMLLMRLKSWGISNFYFILKYQTNITF